MNDTTQIIKEYRKSSLSFRIEGVGTDAKIYFEDEDDLKKQLETLKAGWEKKKELFGI